MIDNDEIVPAAETTAVNPAATGFVEPTINPPEKYDCSNSKKEKSKRGEIFDNFIICWLQEDYEEGLLEYVIMTKKKSKPHKHYVYNNPIADKQQGSADDDSSVKDRMLFDAKSTLDKIKQVMRDRKIRKLEKIKTHWKGLQ